MQGLIIVARTSSERLPKKILKTINGMTLFEILVEKAKMVVNSSQIILATSNLESDDELANLCESKGISCFRGELNNVPKRIYQAAQSKNFTSFSMLEGDEYFVDINYLKLALKILEHTNVDVIKEMNLPLGAWSYGFKTKALGEFVEKFNRDSYDGWVTPMTELENMVTINLGVENIYYPDYLTGPRLTLDYPEDFEVLKRLRNDLGDGIHNLNDVMNHLNKNPEIAEINAHLNQVWKKRWDKVLEDETSKK